jgi:hypothetical protein
VAQQPDRHPFVGAERQPALSARLARLGLPTTVEPDELDPVRSALQGFDLHIVGCVRTPVPAQRVVEPAGVAVIHDSGIELGRTDGSGTGTPSRAVTPCRRVVAARATSRAPATPTAAKGVAATSRPRRVDRLTAALPYSSFLRGAVKNNILHK